jgi:hypothetical protein
MCPSNLIYLYKVTLHKRKVINLTALTNSIVGQNAVVRINVVVACIIPVCVTCTVQYIERSLVQCLKDRGGVKPQPRTTYDFLGVALRPRQRSKR